MAAATDIEKRNRALIAFTLLTGARDGALVSLTLKHVDLAQGRVLMDAREVDTKARKTFMTWFFPVGNEPLRIITEWVDHLRGALLWGEADPLFPRTKVAVGQSGTFEAIGLERECWSTAQPIREIFREAFEQAGLPYFNPHSFRNTLSQLGERITPNIESFKAWSQNLGHERMLTTLTSYGAVAPARQAELVRELGRAKQSKPDLNQLLHDVVRAELASLPQVGGTGRETSNRTHMAK
jgi:integrase